MITKKLAKIYKHAQNWLLLVRCKNKSWRSKHLLAVSATRGDNAEVFPPSFWLLCAETWLLTRKRKQILCMRRTSLTIKGGKQQLNATIKKQTKSLGNQMLAKGCNLPVVPSFDHTASECISSRTINGNAFSFPRDGKSFVFFLTQTCWCSCRWGRSGWFGTPSPWSVWEQPELEASWSRPRPGWWSCKEDTASHCKFNNKKVIEALFFQLADGSENGFKGQHVCG